MEALSKIHHRHQPPALHLSVHHHHRSPFSIPISSISFRTSPSSSSSCSSIRASSSSFNPFPHNHPKTLKPPLFEALLKPLIKSTCIAIAAAALFLGPYGAHNPVFAATAATVEPAKQSTGTTDEEDEKTLEKYLESHPGDVEALRSLMEIKIKAGSLEEAIEIINRLIALQPDEEEWPLMRAHAHIYSGDPESARSGFEEVLAKDPLLVEAYYGLVMAVSQSEPEELISVTRRVEEAMETCKKEKKRENVRDFKLLIAQIRVIEGNYADALKVYQELVKEEPRDFRPYLCQGIIYTLLKKKDEADKQFEKYRRLVPKGHPYAEFFNDTMFGSKIFSQGSENQGAGLKS